MRTWANYLKTFLSTFQRSRSREYLLATRLVHDLGVAAARRVDNLLMYLPTVDAEGTDVIFDDRDRLVAMQLTSVVASLKSASPFANLKICAIWVARTGSQH